MANNWNAFMPIYVTRTTANGETGSLSITAGMGLIIIILLLADVVVWSIVGLIVAFRLLT